MYSNKIKEMIKLRQDNLIKKEKMLQNISDIDKKIKNITDEIMENCNHNWVPDRESSSYDRTEFICTICLLNN